MPKQTTRKIAGVKAGRNKIKIRGIIPIPTKEYKKNLISTRVFPSFLLPGNTRVFPSLP